MKLKELLGKTSAIKLVIMTDKGNGLFCDTRLSFYNETYSRLRNEVEEKEVVGFSLNCGNVLFVLIKAEG